MHSRDILSSNNFVKQVARVRLQTFQTLDSKNALTPDVSSFREIISLRSMAIRPIFYFPMPKKSEYYRNHVIRPLNEHRVTCKQK